MARMITRDELPALVGQELGVSDWLTVDQARIDAFAELTGDRQWIHVDVERARRELGGTIAHGFLTLSLMSTLAADLWRVADIASGLNYGFDRLRFTAAVPAGARVRLRETLLRVEPREAGVLITRHCAVEVENNPRPALVADWLTMLRFG